MNTCQFLFSKYYQTLYSKKLTSTGKKTTLLNKAIWFDFQSNNSCGQRRHTILFDFEWKGNSLTEK